MWVLLLSNHCIGGSVSCFVNAVCSYNATLACFQLISCRRYMESHLHLLIKCLIKTLYTHSSFSIRSHTSHCFYLLSIQLHVSSFTRVNKLPPETSWYIRFCSRRTHFSHGFYLVSVTFSLRANHPVFGFPLSPLLSFLSILSATVALWRLGSPDIFYLFLFHCFL